MIPIVSLLLILAISMTLTRIAAVALVHTGLGREAARFQARSAFTGVGFTTSEAEDVVGHPVRRRIVMWLMLVGNVGIVAAMSTLLLSFIDLEGGREGWIGVAVLSGGIGVLWALASSEWVDRITGRGISWAIARWTSLDTRDYARILHLREDYGITDLRVQDGDWIAGRTLAQSGLAKEGTLVLGIECPGNHFIGAPPPDAEVRADVFHAGAVAEQERVAVEERTRAGR